MRAQEEVDAGEHVVQLALAPLGQRQRGRVEDDARAHVHKLALVAFQGRKVGRERRVARLQLVPRVA